MRQTIIYHLVVVCLVVAANALRSSAVDEAPLPRPVDPLQAEGDRLVVQNRRYNGFVTAVTGRSITITNPGGKETIQEIGPAGGIVRITVRKIPPLPARTFQACELLADGGFTRMFGASRSYGLLDVRIGDRIDINCHRDKGADICDNISIQRRPGGRVPPGNVDDFDGAKFGDGHRWHDRCNAEQFIEEKIVPMKLPRLFARIHR